MPDPLAFIEAADKAITKLIEEKRSEFFGQPVMIERDTRGKFPTLTIRTRELKEPEPTIKRVNYVR